MNSFVYDIPTRVYFGPDQLGNLGKEVSAFGKKALLCCGDGSIKESGLYDRVTAQLKAAGMEVFKPSGIDPNPRISSANAGADICRKEEIDVLLAVGGGSVLDYTRYIGAAAYYDGDGWDILLDRMPMEQCLPIVTVLTLAAAGSEIDSDGVISNPEAKDKIGRMFPPIQPKVSLLDPTETYSVSKCQTTYGSSGVLSHLLGIYFVPGGGSMYMLGCFMEGMIKTVVKYAPTAMKQPDHYKARANLMQTGSWAINGFAGASQNCEWTYRPVKHELSAIYDITYKLRLAIVTPRWTRYVLDATATHRFYQYGVNVFSVDPSLPEMEVAEKSTEMTADFLLGKLGLTSTLTEIDIGDGNFDIMTKRAHGGGILRGYKPLNCEDIRKILTTHL